MNNLINKFRYNVYVDRVNKLPFIHKQMVLEGGKINQKIHIVYVLNHVGLTGGTKVILQHANGLVELGVKVTILSQFPKPDWFPIKSEYICVPFQIELAKYIPVCDVIVATYWEHIGACVASGIAPVVYFEQGDFHLFEWDSLDENRKEIIYNSFQLPYKIIAVSDQISRIIKTNFHRDSKVVHNAIDTRVFYTSDKKATNEKYMMVVGREQTEFKGIKDLKEVYKQLINKGYNIKFLWVTQDEPTERLGEVYVNPPQELIGELYRDAFVYVCGSYYESFPLPPIEAMASGTPVVTTNNIGVNEYAIDNYNCLMTKPGDINSLVEKICNIIDDEDLYNELIKNGLRTANKYSWTVILKDLLIFYEEITRMNVVEINNKNDWYKNISAEDLEIEEDMAKVDMYLSQSKADVIQLPVRYDIIPGMPIYQWKSLIFKKHPSNIGMIERLPIRVKGTIDTVSNKEEITYFINEQYEIALAKFLSLANRYPVGSNTHATYIKWVALCLYELNMDNELNELLNSSIKQYPYYTDLLFIFGSLLSNNGEFNDALEIFQRINLMQDAMYYDEFFGDIALLTSNILKG